MMIRGLRQPSLFVCERVRRFGVGVRIAVDVVVAVAQYDPGKNALTGSGIAHNCRSGNANGGVIATHVQSITAVIGDRGVTHHDAYEN